MKDKKVSNFPTKKNTLRIHKKEREKKNRELKKKRRKNY